MGLDMYLYAIKKGYEGSYSENTEQRIELAYWRKHRFLHGTMENIWEEKGSPLPEGRNPQDTEFNTIPLLLNRDDIKNIINQIKTSSLPETYGFFFGGSKPDANTKKRDLKIFKEALALSKLGYEIYYDSWW